MKSWFLILGLLAVGSPETAFRVVGHDFVLMVRVRSVNTVLDV